MTTEPTCSWLADAILDLQRLLDSGPALRRRLAPAIDRIATMNGGTSLADALLRPGTTPFVRLIDATAADLGLTDDPRIELIGRATLMGYLYVRLQDDLVDEETLVDRASVFAMEVALAEHVRLLALAGVPSAFWIERSRIMARFADVAAREVDSRATAVEFPLELCGEKFLGMSVPLVALAALAGRDELGATLIEFVVHVGTTLQLVNDLLNAAEDHASGRTTPVLRWMANALAGTSSLNEVRAVLLAHPAWTRALELARRQADEARMLAVTAGLPRLAQLAEGIARQVERTDQRLLGQVLGVAI